MFGREKSVFAHILILTFLFVFSILARNPDKNLDQRRVQRDHLGGCALSFWAFLGHRCFAIGLCGLHTDHLFKKIFGHTCSMQKFLDQGSNLSTAVTMLGP